MPVFTMTTTYHRRKDAKLGDLPRMDVYIDGPFWPDAKLSEDDSRAKLAREAYESMKKQAKNNTYEYFRYEKKGGDGDKKKKGKK